MFQPCYVRAYTAYLGVRTIHYYVGYVAYGRFMLRDATMTM